MRIANAHFVKHHYEDADYYYKLLRRTFPRANINSTPTCLAFKPSSAAIKGRATTIGRSRKPRTLIDQTLAQFGTELGAERDRLVTAKGEIHAQQALRSWTVAQFYEKGEHYAAAKLYYNDIVKEYPQTKLAESPHQTRLAPLVRCPTIRRITSNSWKTSSTAATRTR